MEVRDASPEYELTTAKPTVPEGYIELGAVTQWLSGGTPSRSVESYWSGKIPWISASTLRKVEVIESDQCVTPEAVASGSKMAPIDSTLLLVRGSALHNEIRAGIVREPVCFNQDVKALIPNKQIHPKYLTYSILGRESDLLGLVSSAGNTAGVLDTKIVQSFRIWLPGLEEQRAIATALSDVDALLEALDRLIAKKRDLKQAAMQQLLTGQTRLPGFEGEWKGVTLGDFASFHKGKGLPKSALSSNGSEPCIHYGELFTQYGVAIHFTISRTNSCSDAFVSLANDVLMPTSDVTPSGLAKASCVLMDDVLLGGDILVIRADANRVSGIFLSHVIRRKADQVLRLVTGTTVYHLYGSDMAKFAFRLPKLNEQQEIAKVLSDIDTEIAALEQRRAKTAALKQAMMQELLTGRTRLVEPHGQEAVYA
ncbi:MAG TPA: restriction endonuclease subunit S [Gammaproteobacteria bacterium]|nr:restriction endonuclease subunit S [Gammaproteobacteria bacterium]